MYGSNTFCDVSTGDQCDPSTRRLSRDGSVFTRNYEKGRKKVKGKTFFYENRKQEGWDVSRFPKNI